MVEYSPPPPTLDHLNPIQRYMQKGQLDRQDWIRLGALILIYFVIRPYLQKAAKWLFSNEKIEAGEKAQREHMERRAKAKIGANAIRSGKKEEDTVITELDDNKDVVTSGSKVDAGSSAVNRKVKTTANVDKATQDQLLNWDDEPAREDIEGEKTDVMQWLDKWDK